MGDEKSNPGGEKALLTSDETAVESGATTSSRRSYLRYAATAALTIGAGLSSVEPTTAATAYDTVTVPAGTVQHVLVDGNTVLENTLYDVTATGAGVTFVLRDNATVRNVGIKGTNDTDKFVFRMGSSTNNITIDRVYTECFNPNNRGPGGIIATKSSTGTITIKGASIHGWGNNGLYASKTDADLYVSDCYFTNNRTSNFRGGGDYHGNARDAVFTNCVCVIDDLSSVPLYPNGGDRTVGYLARWGTVEVHGCDMYLDPNAPDLNGGTISDNSYCMRTDAKTGSPTLNVYDSQVSPYHRISGDVNYVQNVGSSPSTQAPSYAPTTAEEAASGTTSTSTTTSTSSGGTTTNTNVAVSTGAATNVAATSVTLNGDLTDLGGAASADVGFQYRPSGASSWTATATQTRSSTGTFSVDVTGLTAASDYDFRAVAAASDGTTDTGATASFTTPAALGNTLEIDGSNVSQQVSYAITVSGDIVKGAYANDNDSIVGSTAEGQVNGGIDTYDFSGEVTAVQLSGDVPIYVNGSLLDVSQFLGSPPSIDRYQVTEAGSPNPDANILAEWDVSDPDGDLASGLIEVVDATGTVVASSETSISGDVYYGVDYFVIKHVRGQTFDVNLTVTDAAGHEATATASVTE